MILTKKFLNQVLEQTVAEYNNKIMKIDSINLKYVDKVSFLEGVKADPYIGLCIQKGVYKDIEKEYPGFLVVYNSDKTPLRLLMTGNYTFSICFEIAKDKLKPYKTEQVREYLKHCFAHEITHIYEDRLITKDPEQWQQLLEHNKNIGQMAKEELAENMADKIGNKKEYEFINNKLWEVVTRKMQKIVNNR